MAQWVSEPRKPEVAYKLGGQWVSEPRELEVAYKQIAILYPNVGSGGASDNDGECGLFNTEFTTTRKIVQFGTSTAISKARTWIRLPGSSIPGGSNVEGVYFRFIEYSGGSPCAINIYFNKVGNVDAAPTGRAAALALELTSPILWQPTYTARGTLQSTPDLSSILQPVINLGDYSSGNALMLVFDSVSYGYQTNYVGTYACDSIGDPLYPDATPPSLIATWIGNNQYVSEPRKLEVAYPVWTTDTLGINETGEVGSGVSADDGYGDILSSSFYPIFIFLRMGKYLTQTYRTFLRFPVTIPKGTHLYGAHLKVRAYGNNSVQCLLRVHGNNEDNATAPTSVADLIGKNITEEYSDWITESFIQNSYYQLDVTNIVQEIINRDGWVSGNYLMLLIDSLAGAGLRQVYAYESYSLNGDTPSLIIEH